MLKEADELIKSISHESDRGCILVATALIDSVLEDQIKAKLILEQKKEDQLFQGATAPLGTFSVKIDLSYRLGLITNCERQQLHLLRKIRNECAHQADKQTFDTKKIQSRMREVVNLSSEGWDAFAQVLAWRQGITSLPNDRNEFIDAVGWRVVFEFKFLTLYSYMREKTESIMRLDYRRAT